jgi:hypothetical protein
MTTSNLPARTEGALWLLHLYGKEASAYELWEKNQGMARHGVLPEEYQKVSLIMWRDQETANPFWFADGIMYGLEQAFARGLVDVVDGPPNKNLNLVYNPELVREFLRRKPKDRKKAPFTRSRVRYQLSGLGYIWLTNHVRSDTP